MKMVPTVIENEDGRGIAFDIYSRLLKDRIVFLGDEIDDAEASLVVAQLLYLESQDAEKDIYLYINSPGGSVSAGMAIYDTMRFIKCDVSTVCVGTAASMGAFILAGGAEGKRFALPNAEIMIHQPLGNTGGSAADIQIEAEHIIRTKRKIYELLAQNCKKSYEEIESACDRNNWKTAREALEYGLIDKIANGRSNDYDLL